MKKFLLLVIPFIFCLNSCEEIVEGETLPYEEKLVVRGVVETGLPIHVKVTKTLPVLEEYSAEKAEVKDADVRLFIDDKEFKGSYSLSDYRFDMSDTDIVAGKEYKLTINWHGKTAYSTMRIPLQPEVVNVKKDSTQIIYNDGYSQTIYVLRVAVKPRPNECYVMSYTLTDDTGREIYSSHYFNNIYRADDIEPDGLVHLTNGGDYPNSTDYKITIHVHAFDSKFYEYFATRYNNYNDSPLSEPNKVQWNIKGDGIGMFTGYSTTAVEIK